MAIARPYAKGTHEQLKKNVVKYKRYGTTLAERIEEDPKAALAIVAAWRQETGLHSRVQPLAEPVVEPPSEEQVSPETRLRGMSGEQVADELRRDPGFLQNMAGSGHVDGSVDIRRMTTEQVADALAADPDLLDKLAQVNS